MARNYDPGESSRPASPDALRGVRLGRCARRILLLAPLPSTEPAVILPARDGPGAAQSHRRALRRLAANGLVELTWKRQTVEVRHVRTPAVAWDAEAGVFRPAAPQARMERTTEQRAVRLTSLGALVVDRLRPTLETGGRVRWASLTDIKPE